MRLRLNKQQPCHQAMPTFMGDKSLIYKQLMELLRQVSILEHRWLFLRQPVELQRHSSKNLRMEQAMDLDTITLAKDSLGASKTSTVTLRLETAQPGNHQVYKEAPAQGGQVKVTSIGAAQLMV
jgi:hypothetical protein